MISEIIAYLHSFNDYAYHELNSFLIEKFGNVSMDDIRANLVILKVDNRIYIKDDAHLKLNSHSRINHFDYKNTLMDLSNLIIEAMLTPQEKEKIDNLRRIDKPIYELGLMDLVIINEGKKRRLKDAGYLDSFPEILHLAKPIAHPNKTPSIQTIKNKMVSLSKLIIKHPLWSAIIAGIAVVLFSHFVFHVP